MIRISRLPLAVLVLTLSVLSATAHAQFSVYGSFTVERMTGINASPVLQTLSPLPCSSTLTTQCTAYRDYVNPLGFTGGATYDFKTFGPVTLSADLRGVLTKTHQGAQVYSEGSGSHNYSALGGLKVSSTSLFKHVIPYIQGSGGYARSNYGVLTNAGTTSNGNTIFPGVPTQNNLEYHVYAGADLRFLPWADWRVAEVGYGAIESFGTYAHTYPIYSISTGVVLHFPPRP
jgi:hypothetical protein